MKRVLIVVSSYMPAMAADMQRARMLAWELPRLGWDVEILTPRASEVRQDLVESDNDEFFPPHCSIHEVGSFSRSLFEALGSRTHAWRTLLPIHCAGTRLLRSRRFDLVFFSTATFVYFVLGRRWARRFKVPYVLDFHDPLVKETSKDAPRPCGLKQLFVELLWRMLERTAVGHATGLVSVSPHYLEVLRHRYESLRPSWLMLGRHAVIPFGVREHDLTEARSALPSTTREPVDAIVLAYVGAGGFIMMRGFTLLCRVLAALRASGDSLVCRVRISLYGTVGGWQAGMPRDLADVANRTGVGDLVTEYPKRVSYRHSLEKLVSADGALVLGVDDAGYMPSKLFSYALSGKPLLAILRRESPAFVCLNDAPQLGHTIWFDAQAEMSIDLAATVVSAFLEEAAAKRTFDRHVGLEPHLAPNMARRHVTLFEACLAVPRERIPSQ